MEMGLVLMVEAKQIAEIEVKAKRKQKEKQKEAPVLRGFRQKTTSIRMTAALSKKTSH
jgi:hypothetical protein